MSQGQRFGNDEYWALVFLSFFPAAFSCGFFLTFGSCGDTVSFVVVSTMILPLLLSKSLALFIYLFSALFCIACSVSFLVAKKNFLCVYSVGWHGNMGEGLIKRAGNTVTAKEQRHDTHGTKNITRTALWKRRRRVYGHGARYQQAAAGQLQYLACFHFHPINNHHSQFPCSFSLLYLFVLFIISLLILKHGRGMNG